MAWNFPQEKLYFSITVTKLSVVKDLNFIVDSFSHCITLMVFRAGSDNSVDGSGHVMGKATAQGILTK